MSTLIHNAPAITCSLYVGDQSSIYSFDYSYVPTEGTKITIYFVNPDGVYNVPALVSSASSAPILNLIQKVQITIGGALFSMYALSYELDEDVDRRILKVDFIDDTFRLAKYYVTLTGTFCGDNVYSLGAPVDPRTDAQRVAQAIDPTVQNVKNQSITLDMEYHFSDFLAVLQQVFPTQVNATWDDSITKPIVGDFRSVLDAWCKYHNLVYYFEEGYLVINNPQSLNITFPPIPVDALAVKQSESLDNTFTATASVTFNQDGGQFGDNGTIDTKFGTTAANGVVTTSLGLFPAGADILLPQITPNPNQLVAAAFGQEYWFLYNYTNGTADVECGWTRVNTNQISGADLQQSVQTLLGGTTNGGLSYLDETVFNQRFQYYSQYGSQIAGRYYFSDDQAGAIYAQQGFSWYNQTNGQNFNLQDLLANKAGDSLQMGYYLDGVTPGSGIWEGTKINQFFPGLTLGGNRLVYKDQRVIDLQTPFTLNSLQQSLVHTWFSNLVNGYTSSDGMDFSQVASNGDNIRYVVFQDQVIDSTQIPTPANTTQWQNLTNLFQPATAQINLLGVKTSTVIQSNAPNGTNNIAVSTAPQAVTNFNTLTTLAEPIANIYFTKFGTCASQSSLAQANIKGAFGHRFNPRTLSVDTPVLYSVTRTSSNSYSVLRNLSYLQIPVQGGPSDPASNILVKTSLPQLQSRKEISFTTNYFIPTIPISRFISNGLTSLSVAISSQGVDTSYVFSNSMLFIPDTEVFFDQLERNMRNSWVRQYNPAQNATF